MSSIDYDEYKIETCSITNDECDGFNCADCEVSNRHNDEIKIEEKNNESSILSYALTP